MPSKSLAQQRLFGAEEHGADFPAAAQLRRSMTHQQLHDFASGSMKGKPEHVAKTKAAAGSIRDLASRPRATSRGPKMRMGGRRPTHTTHPARNLGAYGHPKKHR